MAMKGFILETEDELIFSIVPKDGSDWKIVERNKILVKKDALPGETREALEKRMKAIERLIYLYRKRSTKQ